MIDYSKLKTLLERRLKVIADTELRDTAPEAQLHQLQRVSEEITRWTNETKGIPQQLNHFLRQSSLSKALDYIETIEEI